MAFTEIEMRELTRQLVEQIREKDRRRKELLEKPADQYTQADWELAGRELGLIG